MKPTKTIGKEKPVTAKSQRIKSTKNLHCAKCLKILSSEAHLVKHIKTHKPKDFTCDNCGRHFNTKDKLRLHMLNHRKHYKIKCSVCDKEYVTHQSMRKHLRTHFEQHQCDECGQVFKHKRLLQNHISAVHNDDPTIPCNYCTRLFSTTTTRDCHQKAIHPDQQPDTQHFKCPDCPLGFEMKEELRIHSFIHFNGEIHTCTECHQIFKKKKLLIHHMAKHESPSYRCEHCQKLFKYRSNLGKHLRGNRCKPEKFDEGNLQQSAEEVAEAAKKQFIDITVDPSRLNIRLKEKVVKCEENNGSDTFLKIEKVEGGEMIDEDGEKIFNGEKVFKKEEDAGKSAIVFENPKKSPSKSYKTVKNSPQKSSETKIKIESIKSKRTYVKKKPIKIMKISSLPYECDLCDFTCDKKCQILGHIRHHVASNRHKCKNCGETFSTRMKLHFHSMKVHGRGIIGSVEYSKASAECPICHQLFSEERLKFHIKLHEAPTFKCGECEKVFRTEAAVEKHLAGTHGNGKRFTCALCGKSFAKLTVLKQHEEIHNPIKIYVQCEICNTMMLVKSLKLHMAMKHSDKYKEKRHTCECGKAFRYEKQLEKHRNSVHEKVNRGYVYPCPDCNSVFNRREELREHSFVHYNGKIFECECGMKFKKRKLLTIHETVHKNVRFHCDFCSLVFQTRGGRRKHQTKVHGQVVEEVLEIPAFDVVANVDGFGVEFQKQNVF